MNKVIQRHYELLKKSTNMTKLKIISLNCNGLALKEKQSFLITTLKQLKADVILLQETHLSSLPDWEGGATYDFNNNRSGGTAILCDSKYNIKLTNTLKSEDGRICTADIKIADLSFRLINCYAPNEPKARISFIKETLPSYLSLSIKNIVGGDFNCAENLKLDTSRPYF